MGGRYDSVGVRTSALGAVRQSEAASPSRIVVAELAPAMHELPPLQRKKVATTGARPVITVVLRRADPTQNCASCTKQPPECSSRVIEPTQTGGDGVCRLAFGRGSAVTPVTTLYPLQKATACLQVPGNANACAAPGVRCRRSSEKRSSAAYGGRSADRVYHASRPQGPALGAVQGWLFDCLQRNDSIKRSPQCDANWVLGIDEPRRRTVPQPA